MNKKGKLKGMTLTELLIVLAILGILMLLAFPVLMPIFQKTRSTEAKLNLSHLATLQKAYFLEHAKYGSDFQAIGFEQEALVTEENGKAHYKVEVLSASHSDFLARATAVTDFDGDGQFNVWEIDKNGISKEIVED